MLHLFEPAGVGGHASQYVCQFRRISRRELESRYTFFDQLRLSADVSHDDGQTHGKSFYDGQTEALQADRREDQNVAFLQTPVAPRTMNDQIPVAVDALILRLMAKRAVDRYESAAELAELLDALEVQG